MISVTQIKEITNAKQINGKIQTKINKFNISVNQHYKEDFYLPIFWREDRHKYILNAVHNGAIGFMICSSCENYRDIVLEAKKINPNILILEVENINDAIYQMALFMRKKHNKIPVISVTGSVGKTSTCQMITSVLRQEKKVLSDQGNNNTKPLLSNLMLELDGYEMAVLEAGIGKKDVMEEISKLLEPSIAVIHNIGTAHIGILGSKENILQEKTLLTKYMKDDKLVLLNKDDPLLENLKLNEKYKVIKYSMKEAQNIKQKKGQITFEVKVYGENTHFCVHTYGTHNILNAICAIRIGEWKNISKENIVKGIAEFRNRDRRFCVIEKNGYTIIDDTYNASFASMKAGLIAANEMGKNQRKIAVLGEMLALGDYAKKMHNKVGEIFAEVKFDIVLTQGENTKYICETAKKYMKSKKVINFSTQDELVEQLKKEIQRGDLIYLKASKKMNFNQIVEKIK